MTVEANTVRYSYTGNGTTTVFPFPAKFLVNTDIIVFINQVQQSSGYVVAGAGVNTGGNVTITPAPASGAAIVLLRDPPISQLTTFSDAAATLGNTLENPLDRLTMGLQRLKDTQDRTFRLADGDPVTSLTLPSSTTRAGKALVFDSSGVPIAAAIPGLKPFATNAEALAGTATDVAMAPATTKSVLDSRLVTFLATGATSSSDLRDIIGRLGLTPYDRGAVDNGSTDDSGAWNAAIATLASAGGGCLLVPISKVGAWRLASQVSVLGSRVRILGIGGNPVVNDPRTSGDLFVVGSTSSSPIYDNEIRNLHIVQGGARTGGRAILLQNVGRAQVTDFVIEGCYAGIEFGYVANTCKVRDGTIIMQNGTGGAAVRAATVGTSSAQRMDNLFFEGIVVQGYNAGAYGYVFDGFVNTITIRDCSALGTVIGLSALNSYGNSALGTVNYVTADNFVTDRAKSLSVKINTGIDWKFANCNFSNTTGADTATPYPQGSADADCVQVAGVSGGSFNPGKLDFVGCTFGQCRQSALSLTYCSGVRILGGEMRNTSLASNNNPVLFIGPYANYVKQSSCDMYASSAKYGVAQDSTAYGYHGRGNDIYSPQIAATIFNGGGADNT